jgi:hypothetical protein
MKAFFYIITWFLIFNFKAFSEEITFNCKFDKWVEQKMMEEIYKSKDDLSPEITIDKQIIFKKNNDTEIFVTDTSFIYPPINEKIKVSIKKDELIFTYGELENMFEVFILNRISGDLIKDVKRFDEKVTIYYKCKKTDKLI